MPNNCKTLPEGPLRSRRLPLFRLTRDGYSGRPEAKATTVVCHVVGRDAGPTLPVLRLVQYRLRRTMGRAMTRSRPIAQDPW